MTTIRILGGLDEQRDTAREAARWFVDHGMPISRDVHITLRFHYLVDEDGFAIWKGAQSSSQARIFQVGLARRLFDDALVSTVLHELVHVHQMVHRTLRYRDSGEECRVHWKDRDYTHTAYSQQPWERQAYRLEKKLLTRYHRSLA